MRRFIIGQLNPRAKGEKWTKLRTVRAMSYRGAEEKYAASFGLVVGDGSGGPHRLAEISGHFVSAWVRTLHENEAGLDVAD